MQSHTIQAKPLRFRWGFLFPSPLSIPRKASSGSFDTKKPWLRWRRLSSVRQFSQAEQWQGRKEDKRSCESSGTGR
jgi:hypothetical protein